MHVVVQYQHPIEVYFLFSFFFPLQSDYTLWRLKVFVKDALKVKAQAAAQVPEGIGGHKVATSKRNRESCDTVAKPVKRTKKISAM